MTDKELVLSFLKPNVLDKMIRDNVKEWWDGSIFDLWQDRARSGRLRLKEKMTDPTWLPSVLEV